MKPTTKNRRLLGWQLCHPKHYAGEPLAAPAVYAQEPPPPPGDAPPQYSASNPSPEWRARVLTLRS